MCMQRQGQGELVPFDSEQREPQIDYVEGKDKQNFKSQWIISSS